MKHQAIYNLYKNVVSIDDSTGAFDAQGNLVLINEPDVEIEIARLQSEYQANAYKYKRAAEYPSFADQFDTIFHKGLDAWKKEIQAVKDKYPKGK